MQPIRATTARRRAALALAGAATVVVGSFVGSPGAMAEPGTPDVDEIVHSENVTHLANVPKQDAFAAAGAFGSDITFTGNFAIDGNYQGFVIYDISQPAEPRIVSQVSCPGPQNDVSVHGNLLVLSTDSARSNDSCQSEDSSSADPNNWQGIKIFDISDKAHPQYIRSVRTDCGSHTHTLVPDNDSADLYVYVSSYNPSTRFPSCQPPHDYVSVVKVPAGHPEDAAVVGKPVLFPDGGNPGGDDRSRQTSGCHDVTVYPEKDLAAGACMGDGVLMDISDREHPRVIDTVQDNVNFAFWHSATFNNSGTKVVFTDELGGGGAATCNVEVGQDRGADGIYDIVGQGDQRELVFRSYFKIPRMQEDTENCVAHNGSLIPVPFRDIMVQAWYQGGISVWDFTDSANPREIAFFERGPLSEEFGIGGSWSAYYYNGHIYSSDIQKGLDVLELNDPRTFMGRFWRMDVLNAQSQQEFWPFF